ncbi:MAG: cyclodeaminase/cyclohydrolase family protein [Candidatus Omnitrophica bacterium]|nr:cyclodeaminase/cyclohydrolase family protein [Candidatus Omnitrophota bacterium]
MIVEKSVQRFIKELASPSPVPGGGNVSCVVAAQAAGLVSMACLISARREEALRKRTALKELAASADVLIDLGLSLAELDAEVFTRLIQIFKTRFRSSAERRRSLREALSFCAAACLDLLLLAREGALLSARASRLAGHEMLSEIHTAVFLWDAAFEGARINTRANLAWLKEREVERRVRGFVEKVSVSYRKQRAMTLKALRARGARI